MEDLAARDVSILDRGRSPATASQEAPAQQASDSQPRVAPGDMTAVGTAVPGVGRSGNVKLNKKMVDFLTSLRQEVPTDIPLVVTSGIRTTEEQASAMMKKRNLKDDLVALYGEKVKPVLAVDNTVPAMKAVLDDMVKKGVYMSQHMQANSVDLRSTGWNADQKKKVMDAVKKLGATPLLETKPPHLHITLPG